MAGIYGPVQDSDASMKRIPPFFALRALEAASRHRSYSRAANELAVTHGAVSHQVRRLEAELGARLFERRGNTMIPTPEAQRLSGEVERALDILREAVSEFDAAAERDPLVVSIDTQFAMRWLPPRLPRLLGDPAGERIEIRVEERCADFVTDGVDVGVRYGAGDWEGVNAERLFNETLFPVCTAEVAADLPIRGSEDLLEAPLLHHGHRPWRLWFDAHGLPEPPRQGLQFEDSTMLIEAAAQGLGVALARDVLIETDLKTGRLVRPLDGCVPSEFGFFVVWRADSRKRARIQALCDWLSAEAGLAA